MYLCTCGGGSCVCTGQIPIKWVYCRSGRLRRGEYQIYHLEQRANTICFGLKKKCLGLNLLDFFSLSLELFPVSHCIFEAWYSKNKVLESETYYVFNTQHLENLKSFCIQCSDGRLGPRSSFVFCTYGYLKKNSFLKWLVC